MVMRNMIVLNTVSELIALIDNTTMSTFVGNVAFAGDLLAHARLYGNEISIDHELGFADDGGYIRIDDDGYVVDDFAIC